MMRKGIIYRATCIETWNAYIGKTVRKLNKRIKEHWYDSQTCDTKFYRAANKYGWDTFIWEILYQDIPESDLCALEVKTITDLDTYNNGLNSTPGGDNSPMKYPEIRAKVSGTNHRLFGKHLPKETRDKISVANNGERNANYGKSTSEERRHKISQSLLGNVPWNKGIPRTEETKSKISRANKGRKRSLESRLKQSKSVSGEKNHQFGKIGVLAPNYGKPKSEETLRKMSQAATARYNKPDLTGQVFGKWTVIGKGKRKETSRDTLWTVMCECGNIFNLPRRSLENGRSKMCRPCSYATRRKPTPHSKQ